MAWLPMYLDRPDAALLLSWLNEDEEVAFIVLAESHVRQTEKLRRLLDSGQGFTFYNLLGGLPQGVKVVNRWVAVPRLESMPDGHYTLWHVPSGPLPQSREDRMIRDPWAGWLETRPGADPSRPYFGADHGGILDLEVQTRRLRHLETENDFVTVRRRVVDRRVIGLSSFGWSANHYRCIGRQAPAVTERWWGRLRRHVRCVATRIPRSGPLDGPHAEIYAFPAAYKAIRGGIARSDNP
jgi:hypothetical protein